MITPSVDDVEVHALDILARVVDAAIGGAPVTVRLGCIQPGHALELRFV